MGPDAGETGAAKRRIALRAALLDGDQALTQLADALASKEARLLTQGNVDAGPTLEVGARGAAARATGEGVDRGAFRAAEVAR